MLNLKGFSDINLAIPCMKVKLALVNDLGIECELFLDPLVQVLLLFLKIFIIQAFLRATLTLVGHGRKRARK